MQTCVKPFSVTVLTRGLPTSTALLMVRIPREVESRLILRDEHALAQSPARTRNEPLFVVMFLNSAFGTVRHMRFNSRCLPCVQIRSGHSVAKGLRKSIPTRVPAISANLLRRHARPDGCLNLNGDNARDYESCGSAGQLMSMDFASALADYRQAADWEIVLVDEVAS
jgi:hypothetical protein